MTKLTIGRVGLDVDVDGVLEWESDGDDLQVRLEIYSSTADALAIRQQILGYTSTADEAFVPVTWDMEPEADGYYTVESASVTPHRDGADLWYVDVKLRRVLGYAAPLLELTTLGAQRTSNHLTGTQSRQAFAVPDAARSVALYDRVTGAYLSAITHTLRESATGDLKAYRSSTLTAEYVLQFFAPPADHYAGASTLYAGEGLRAVVGRQVPNTPDAWRLSNGLLELEPVASSTFDLRYRMWLAATNAWSPWVTFSMVAGSTAGTRTPMPAPHSVTVLRNGPEEVGIRMLTTTASNEYSPVTLDFSLRRGLRAFDVELRSTVTTHFALRCASFAAATSVATDEDRYRKVIGSVYMVMMAPYTIGQTSNDMHPNVAAVTNVNAWSFGLGMTEVADLVDTDLRAAEEYFFASSAKQSVVAQ